MKVWNMIAEVKIFNKTGNSLKFPFEEKVGVYWKENPGNQKKTT